MDSGWAKGKYIRVTGVASELITDEFSGPLGKDKMSLRPDYIGNSADIGIVVAISC